MDKLCQLIIYLNKDTKTPEGLITGLGKWKFFDPLSLLPPICENNYYIEVNIMDENKQISIYDLFQFDQESEQQFKALINGIKYLMAKSVNSQSSISIHDIELLKPYYDITHIFSPTIINPNYDPNKPHSCLEPPLIYANYEIEEILSINTSDYKTYFYDCFSPSDFLFSVLHYLAFNNYKFAKCKHCSRYFVTNNLKKLYCERKSQHVKYQKYKCYNAAKEAKRAIHNDYRKIYKRFYNSGKQFDLKWIEFDRKFYDAFNALKAHPDYNAIDRCTKLISDMNEK